MERHFPWVLLLEVLGGAPHGLDLDETCRLLPKRHPERVRHALTTLWRLRIIKRNRYQKYPTGRPRDRWRLRPEGQDLMELIWKTDERRYALRLPEVQILSSAAKLLRRIGLFSVRRRPRTPAWWNNRQLQWG